MSVQDLIDKLNKIEDKNLPVCFSNNVAGKDESGDSFVVNHIYDFADCVVLDS